jgi:hypothetical protein
LDRHTQRAFAFLVVRKALFDGAEPLGPAVTLEVSARAIQQTCQLFP